MGDRIAQIIFEKIKTPQRKESDSLEGTDRGGEGFGSTGVHTVLQTNEGKSDSVNEHSTDKMKLKTINDAKKDQSFLSQSRLIITARQMNKLAKDDQPVFLAIVREVNQVPQEKKVNK